VEARDDEMKSGKERPAKKEKKPRPRWQRIAWRTLRILFVPLMCLAALIAGLYVGYVTIGGQDPSEIWNIRTWKHVFDLMFSQT